MIESILAILGMILAVWVMYVHLEIAYLFLRFLVHHWWAFALFVVLPFVYAFFKRDR